MEHFTGVEIVTHPSGEMLRIRIFEWQESVGDRKYKAKDDQEYKGEALANKEKGEKEKKRKNLF